MKIRVYAVTVNSTSPAIQLPRLCTPDLIVVAIQGLNDAPADAVEAMVAVLKSKSTLYEEVTRAVLANMATIVFIRTKLRNQSAIAQLCMNTIPPTSKCTTFIITRFCIQEPESDHWSGSYSTSCCFVNVQLAAQPTDIKVRANQLEQLLNQLKSCKSDVMVVLGKFNFALHNTTAYDSSQLAIAKMYAELLAQHDELVLHDEFDRLFKECALNVPPILPPAQSGCCVPSSPALPGWADRIFFSKNLIIQGYFHDTPNQLACVARYETS